MKRKSRTSRSEETETQAFSFPADAASANGNQQEKNRSRTVSVDKDAVSITNASLHMKQSISSTVNAFFDAANNEDDDHENENGDDQSQLFTGKWNNSTYDDDDANDKEFYDDHVYDDHPVMTPQQQSEEQQQQNVLFNSLHSSFGTNSIVSSTGKTVAFMVELPVKGCQFSRGFQKWQKNVDAKVFLERGYRVKQDTNAVYLMNANVALRTDATIGFVPPLITTVLGPWLDDLKTFYFGNGNNTQNNNYRTEFVSVQHKELFSVDALMYFDQTLKRDHTTRFTLVVSAHSEDVALLETTLKSNLQTQKNEWRRRQDAERENFYNNRNHYHHHDQKDQDGDERNRDGNQRDRDGNDRSRDGNDRNRDGNDRNRDGNDRNRDGNDRNRDGNDRNRDGNYNSLPFRPRSTTMNVDRPFYRYPNRHSYQGENSLHESNFKDVRKENSEAEPNVSAGPSMGALKMGPNNLAPNMEPESNNNNNNNNRSFSNGGQSYRNSGGGGYRNNNSNRGGYHHNSYAPRPYSLKRNNAFIQNNEQPGNVGSEEHFSGKQVPAENNDQGPTYESRGRVPTNYYDREDSPSLKRSRYK